jgi:hypothetical protein
VYGQPVSEVQAAGVQGSNGIVYCYTGGAAMAPQIAVRGDGAVFMTEPTNNGFPQITGPVGDYWIPRSSITDIYGTVVYVQCCVGPPMVNTDGTTYLEYEVRNNSYTRVTSDTLYLMQINPDNTSSSTVLSATTQNETQLPGPVIPDGNGGVLATWTVSPVNAPVPQYPYQAADVVSGVVGTPYNLPFSPASTTFGKSPTLVLGENGVAFASGPSTTTDGMNTAVDQIASFNVTSGAPNWTYQGTAGNKLNIVQATAGGGITINDSSAGVIQFDATGADISSAAVRRVYSASVHPNDSTGSSSFLQGAVPIDLSTWVSTASGTVTSLWNPNGTNGILTLLAQSVYPMPRGNTHDQNSTPLCQRTNVNCALAPSSDKQAFSDRTLTNVREVQYWLFSLQNGTLTPFKTSQIQGVKIEEWEAHSSNSAVDSCSWQKLDSICESPNINDGKGGVDPTGQYTDQIGLPSGWAPFTIDQQFLVDRQGVQVFWPYTVTNPQGQPQATWYGAWGTPSSSPPGFQPNQTAYVTNGWAVITQINVNMNTATACSSGCDTIPAQQASPPRQ